MFFTTEVKKEGNYPVSHTEKIGINTNAIYSIMNRNDNTIEFYVGGSSHYTKLFNSEQEKEDYLNCIATKLELMEFIRLKWRDRSSNPHDEIINFNKVARIDRSDDGCTLFIKLDGGTPDISFKNINDANQYYDYIMEKLRAVKI